MTDRAKEARERIAAVLSDEPWVGGRGWTERQIQAREDRAKRKQQRSTHQQEPSEYQEQLDLVRWMRQRGLVFCHVPNQGGRGNDYARRGAMLRAMGLRAGMPDLLVFSRVPGRDDIRGIGIELKRRSNGSVSPQQVERHMELTDCGWLVFVSRGADYAIERLTALYGPGIAT